jgi:hypothetical protein
MDNIKISFGYDENKYYRVAYFHFGQIVTSISDKMPYIDDELASGSCYLSIPQHARDIFVKHRANRISSEDNPLMIGFLKQLFIGEDDIFEKTLTSRNVTSSYVSVDVSHDPNIQSLSKDPEFQALNSQLARQNQVSA